MKEYSQNYSAVKAREYRAKDPEGNRQYQRDYRKLHPEKHRLRDYNSALKKRYGISLAEFNEMWAQQQGRCACCNREMRRGGQENLSSCVDHDHSTGKVRAILCAGCNVAIAHLGEDPIRCEQAAAYLRQHK